MTSAWIVTGGPAVDVLDEDAHAELPLELLDARRHDRRS